MKTINNSEGQGSVYIATNLVNGKQYVGKSINFQKRLTHHIHEAKTGTGYYFQRAIKKYGIQNFMFIKFDLKQEQTADAEMMWINLLNTKRPNGYNLTDGGEGIVDSSGTIAKKISKALKGRKYSDETIKKMSESAKGRICSEITKQKISKAGKGRTCSKLTRQKISKANKGQKRSIEFIEKMRNPKTINHKENLSKSLTKYFEKHEHPMTGKKSWNKGKTKVYSQETLHKMSTAAERRWQIKRGLQ